MGGISYNFKAGIFLNCFLVTKWTVHSFVQIETNAGEEKALKSRSDTKLHSCTVEYFDAEFFFHLKARKWFFKLKSSTLKKIKKFNFAAKPHEVANFTRYKFMKTHNRAKPRSRRNYCICYSSSTALLTKCLRTFIICLYARMYRKVKKKALLYADIHTSYLKQYVSNLTSPGQNEVVIHRIVSFAYNHRGRLESESQ